MTSPVFNVSISKRFGLGYAPASVFWLNVSWWDMIRAGLCPAMKRALFVGRIPTLPHTQRPVRTEKEASDPQQPSRNNWSLDKRTPASRHSRSKTTVTALCSSFTVCIAACRPTWVVAWTVQQADWLIDRLTDWLITVGHLRHVNPLQNMNISTTTLKERVFDLLPPGVIIMRVRDGTLSVAETLVWYSLPASFSQWRP